mmetsp:Transcript_117172/g.269077  ORF Transcript_117172/g.269077 Transcript_117172/m.269077 type:complete len:164 (+) Transcript_117172:1063-1554(+)
MSEFRSVVFAAAGGAVLALAFVWLGRQAQPCKSENGSGERLPLRGEQVGECVPGSVPVPFDSTSFAALLPRIRRLPLQQKIKGSSAGIRLVVLVASGKGGVGKSSVATNFAFALSKELGASVGLMDADVRTSQPDLARGFLRPRAGVWSVFTLACSSQRSAEV